MGVYLVGVDPVGDDPQLKDSIQRAAFVIVQELFLTETAKLADVVFPAQAAVERSGTYITGERRAQAFGAAVPALEGTRADHAITSALITAIGQPALPESAMELFTTAFPVVEYASLLQTHEQWPLIGDADAYYGGTGSKNTFGLGARLPLVTGGEMPARTPEPEKINLEKTHYLSVPVTFLYDHGQLMAHTPLLQPRVVPAGISIHPALSEKLGITSGDTLKLKLDGDVVSAKVMIDPVQPEEVLLLVRSAELPAAQPAAVEILVTESAKEGGAL
jgi:predicted molibdopterin-dependent oxidoreductase YjgC